MSFHRKAWRRQKAVSRARLIRRYRKGHPKLGCYKCWYDCYEVEGDRCPECNAVIERETPWWRDGRFSIRFLVLVGLVPPLLSIAGYVWFELEMAQPATLKSRNALIALMIYRGSLYLLGPFLMLFPAVRTRKNRHAVTRIYVTLGPTILWLLLMTALDWNATEA